MNWIKQNSFLFGLAAVTLVGTLILWLLGSSAATRYEEAKDAYDTALKDAKKYEKLNPYPNAQNLKSKQLAIEAYSEDVAELQKAFDAYRPGELENITTTAFSDNLKSAVRESRQAFSKDVELPEDYFMGFEAYRNGIPNGNATGILNHQLDVVKKLVISLADSGATSLININRTKLTEEDGKPFEPAKGQVTRELPLELVFEGPESAVRQFLTSVVNDQEHYLVVRSIRIANEKQQPPRVGDARFEGRPANRGAGEGADAAAANKGVPNFAELFKDPEVKPEPDPEQPEEAPAPPIPEPVAMDDSRILYQVLGEEKLQVFVRLDLVLFLEAKELP